MRRKRARSVAKKKTRRKKPASNKAISRRPPAKPLRWNPDPEDVQRSVIKLVLSLVEFIR